MSGLAALVRRFAEDRRYGDIANNPLAQFGRQGRQYLGATLLPEQARAENMYREEFVRYRTVIANGGTRYSPVQLKGNDLFGSMMVELGYSDVGAELTAQDYDSLQRLIMRSADMEAIATLTNWLDFRVVAPLKEFNEWARWQAIATASVPITGANKFQDTVTYSNPSGHRVAAGGTWSNPAYDPWDDIMGIAEMLAGKGYTVSRIITSKAVVAIMGANPNVAQRTGRVTITGSNVTIAGGARASLASINSALAEDNLPAIETYDLQYATETGTNRFLPAGTMVFACETGRDVEIDAGDTRLYFPNTLGYVGIGVAAGQPDPGTIIRMDLYENKPPRIAAEGWQASLPVILDPEALAVINSIA